MVPPEIEEDAADIEEEITGCHGIECVSYH